METDRKELVLLPPESKVVPPKKRTILIYCAIAVLISSLISWSLVYFTYHHSPKDFSVTVDPDNGSINASDFIQTNVIILSRNGYSNSVSLTARNLPAGVKVTFSPQSIVPTASSIMTIETNKSSLYNISIWGLGSDGMEHCADYKLNTNG